MKILASTVFHVPGFPEFEAGLTYEVEDTLGAALIDRNIATLATAEAPKPEPKKEEEIKPEIK